MAGFQKTNFGVSSAEGAGNTKIGFIMRIAGFNLYSKASFSYNPKPKKRVAALRAATRFLGFANSCN